MKLLSEYLKRTWEMCKWEEQENKKKDILIERKHEKITY